MLSMTAQFLVEHWREVVIAVCVFFLMKAVANYTQMKHEIADLRTSLADANAAIDLLDKEDKNQKQIEESADEKIVDLRKKQDATTPMCPAVRAAISSLH